MHSAAPITLMRHGSGAPALRLGLGPGWRPAGALRQLQTLLEEHSFWAQGRSLAGLRTMLKGSAAAVSLWQSGQLVGFCRASSDGRYRAVLWDVVVAPELQGQGLGRRLVEALLELPQLRRVERVYLMTSNSAGFYKQLGFMSMGSQQLMLRVNASTSG
ncbi:MAG: GNAT family N-acetyltransferase [Cyanobacteriota bacterium]|nr:GNAT family N-acetyltransferase [Cyanobacteriota bacterium]